MLKRCITCYVLCSKGIAHPEAIFTVDEHIAKILPHRYPFALVDKVIYFEPGKRAVGIKCITNNEPQFTGHFPDRPIMPGVLQVFNHIPLTSTCSICAPEAVFCSVPGIHSYCMLAGTPETAFIITQPGARPRFGSSACG
eukprot:TRINITY_DN587_c0_g1_i4.p2 TRINITY_DN587_c0_g1~~TRINITY_DN587_c0_g1_i4.p2  ORF type:complete len:140 (+),score=14.35 TRINITY_DN587_c0_g1_i4:454-873(+)